MIRLAVRELRSGFAQHVATLVVTVIGAVFATTVIETDGVLRAQSVVGGFMSHGYVVLLLDVLGYVFLFVALFVSVIVVANTFGIVMESRLRRIALLRLLGATGESLRGAVALEGAAVGLAGGVIGTGLGVVLIAGINRVLIDDRVFLAAPLHLITPLLIAPLVISVATTGGAAWFGSRRVLVVSPIEATGAAVEPDGAEIRRRVRLGSWPVAGLLIGGTVLLLTGVAVGAVTPFGLFLAAPGGAVSFLGVVLGSGVLLPPLLHAVGGLFGPSVPAALARANARRYPARGARSAVGLMIGVALITMFAVAAATFATQAGAVAASAGPDEAASDQTFVTLILGVLDVLIGFSLVIAAVGLVNSLTLGVLQRRREIGLLRAMGLTRRQVSAMVLVESGQLTLTGGLSGIVLGVLYGWAASVTALSSDHHIGGYFLPTVPAALIGIVVAAAAALAVLASLLPARRALSMSPVEALAVD